MEFRKVQIARTVHTPAKLNLYLDVLGRRVDGYHELETLMVPIGLRDSLTICPTPPPADGSVGEISLTVRSALGAYSQSGTRDAVPIGPENLVARALRLLRERSGIRAGARVQLVKRIPMAAGLGGGSSDAAAALRLGNRVWGLGYSTPQLLSLAAEIGSDVPFFIIGRAAICRGRGEAVEPISAGPRMHVVVLKPPVGLSTPQVFRAFDSFCAPHCRELPSASRVSAVVVALRRGDWPALGRAMSNQLERAADRLAPWLAQVRAVFRRLDCVGHQLSGSGSAYFGLCRHAAHARKLASMLQAKRLGFALATSSCP